MDKVILRLTIDQKDPVPAQILGQSLCAFDKQYQRFLESKNVDYDRQLTPLAVSAVKEGSQIFEFISMTTATLGPILTSDPSLIIEYSRFLIDAWDFLLGKKETPPVEMTARDFNNLSHSVNPTVMSLDGQATMGLSIINNGQMTVNFGVGRSEATAIKYRAEMLESKLDLPRTEIRPRVLMKWAQARFDDVERGNKAIVTSISQTPIKTIFLDEKCHTLITHNDQRFKSDWQDLIYIVDVEVNYVGDRPIAYRVLKYYPEDTIDPNNI